MNLWDNCEHRGMGTVLYIEGMGHPFPRVFCQRFEPWQERFIEAYRGAGL